MGKRKVRTGCRTCKIRKVKCDETYPACRRCISTGRTCDGYGIWGGGGRNHGDHELSKVSEPPASNQRTSRVPRPGYVSILVASAEEKEHFDWFERRTVTKVHGSFFSKFWTTLILQASLGESAVLHAAIALSSVHRQGTLYILDPGYDNGVTDKAEHTTLHHFSKAINNLQPHLSVTSEASSRVVLITCIVFITLDLLRGHFTTAEMHLKKGLALIQILQPFSRRRNELSHTPLSETADDWIMEAFMRLHGSADLIRLINRLPCQVLLHGSDLVSSPTNFYSLKEAWEHLDRLLDQIFDLNNKVLEHEAKCRDTDPSYSAYLRKNQQKIQAGLVLWLETYEASQSTFHERDWICEEDLGKGLRVTELHHQMLTIMAYVCLSVSDEEIYDSHTNSFVQLINKAADLWSYSLHTYTAEPQQCPSQFTNIARSIIDKGCIAPLYYTAVKCRVHRIRIQAFRLLETMNHREGFWDAIIMTNVAWKVITTEERNYYDDIDPLNNVFSLSSSPTSSDLSLPTLPASYRLRDIEIVLSGNPVSKVLLLCKQEQNGRDYKVQIGEYDVSTQQWINEEDFSPSEMWHYNLNSS